jgi:hypothetical protein
MYWATHFLSQFHDTPYGDEIAFWGDTPLNASFLNGVPFHSVSTAGDITRHQLASKLKAALEHFLYNTTSGWFVRIVGDTAINYKTMPMLLDDLNREFDPISDRIVQGACLGKFRLTYIQGGSGFLFSRRAGYDLVNDWAWVKANAPNYRNDDRLLSVYLERANISFREATNRWFLGHSFWKFTSAFNAVSFKGHEPCVSMPVSYAGCRAHFTRVKDLVFWHDRAPFKEFIGRIDEIRALAADDLYFHVPYTNPVLCQGNGSISGYYD